MKKPLKVYWSKSLKNGKQNFGDRLSPALCEVVSRRKVTWTHWRRCELAAVGSILQKFTKNTLRRRTNIWGSGFLEAKPHFDTKHDFHAIRGKLSAQIITNRNIQVLGDPGLLCCLLSSQRFDKKYAVGIIPHYKDQQNEVISAFVKNNDRYVKFIDVFSDTMSFIQQIKECELILSTSLHGLIVADAFAIPNAWIQVSSLVRGNGFKFRDYYSAFAIENIDPFPFNQQTSVEDLQVIHHDYHRENIQQIQKNLLQAFPF